MKPYKNLSGTSGVVAYDDGSNFIKVEFRDSSIYLYTDNATGVENIQLMKGLAAQGSGLNSFINTNVKHLYEAKLR